MYHLMPTGVICLLFVVACTIPPDLVLGTRDHSIRPKVREVHRQLREGQESALCSRLSVQPGSAPELAHPALDSRHVQRTASPYWASGLRSGGGHDDRLDCSFDLPAPLYVRARGDFYRGGLRLAFADGKLTAAEDWQRPLWGPAKMGCPPLVFLRLLFSYRSLHELRSIQPDVWVEGSDAAPAQLLLLQPLHEQSLALLGPPAHHFYYPTSLRRFMVSGRHSLTGEGSPLDTIGVGIPRLALSVNTSGCVVPPIYEGLFWPHFPVC